MKNNKKWIFNLSILDFYNGENKYEDKYENEKNFEEKNEENEKNKNSKKQINKIGIKSEEKLIKFKDEDEDENLVRNLGELSKSMSLDELNTNLNYFKNKSHLYSSKVIVLRNEIKKREKRNKKWI